MKDAAVVDLLNKIMEMELAGVVRYTHYSLMVYGFGRIPIVSWLRGEAQTSLQHAQTAGELVTHLGSHPSLAIGPLLETHKHEIGDILRESMEHESKSLALYRELLSHVQGESVMLEEYARNDDLRGGAAPGRGRQDAAPAGRDPLRCGSRASCDRAPAQVALGDSAPERGRSPQLGHFVRGYPRNCARSLESKC